MFAACTNLTNFQLPSATTEIKEMAFAGCKNLELTVSEMVTTFVQTVLKMSKWSTAHPTVPVLSIVKKTA